MLLILFLWHHTFGLFSVNPELTLWRCQLLQAESRFVVFLWYSLPLGSLGDWFQARCGYQKL